ncbi:MAG: 50S ribosomal protein L24 [Planctomycetota bacterium]
MPAIHKAAPTRKKMHVKKGDKVVVIAGRWRSSEPREVLKVDALKSRVVVQGVNLRWKNTARSQQNPKGERVQKEFPIASSNVLLWSEKAKKGVRTRSQVVDGKRVRVGTCGTKFD